MLSLNGVKNCFLFWVDTLDYYFKSSETSDAFFDLDFELPFTPLVFLFGESNKASLASSCMWNIHLK